MEEPREMMTAEQSVAASGNWRSTSPWVEVSQKMIDEFADATLDHQFIHIDPERAKAETPFGGTIAHGFLSLSLLSKFGYDALPGISGTTMGINYGFDKIRFINPVRSGSRVRAHFTLDESEIRKPGELMRKYGVTVEIEGVDKPALVAQWLTMVFYDPAAQA